MKIYESSKIRNIGIFGHGSSGKTSLAEAMLFMAGITTRLGRVESGNTVMDFEPEEIKKGISISGAVASFDWKKVLINLIDTPGDANFLTDTTNILSGVDSILLTICAASGVEVITERLWELCITKGLPRIIFINKMDRERADFEKCLKEIRESFKINPLPLQIPIGEQDKFSGVIDLLAKKAYIYEKDGSGKYSMADPPEEISGQVEEYRTKALEAIAETDEKLLDLYLGGEEISINDLKNGLRKGFIEGQLLPVMVGSATNNIGIGPVLDFITEVLPTPFERKGFAAKDKDGQPITVESKEDTKQFAALVFKTVMDQMGKLSIFRVISGEVKSNSQIYNVSRQKYERIGQIVKLIGKKKEPVDSAPAGDIAAAVKMEDTFTGNTIADSKAGFVIDEIHAPIPMLSFAIQPKSKGDEEKIFGGLNRICEEDISLQIKREEQTHEVILSGMGQGHLDAAIEKLRNRYKVDVVLSTPKVPYKETIKGRATSRYRHKKQTGGRGQFGECEIIISSLDRGQGFLFLDEIVGGVIPRQYIPAVEKGIVEASSQGVIAGYPVIDFQIELVDGKYHEVDSSELAFKLAGSKAFKKAVLDAKPILLEPIMIMEIIVPEDKTGDIMGDLSSRRGRVSGYESRGKNTIIKAITPLAEILKYEPDLRSMTSGKGSFTTSFSHYEEVPHELALKIIEEARKLRGIEEEEED